MPHVFVRGSKYSKNCFLFDDIFTLVCEDIRYIFWPKESLSMQNVWLPTSISSSVPQFSLVSISEVIRECVSGGTNKTSSPQSCRNAGRSFEAGEKCLQKQARIRKRGKAEKCGAVKIFEFIWIHRTVYRVHMRECRYFRFKHLLNATWQAQK
jgi:hypothetical protein